MCALVTGVQTCALPFLDDPGIVATPWRDGPLQVAVAADAKLGAKRRASVAELSRQAWLLREAGSGTRQVAQRMLRRRGIRPARLIELGSNEIGRASCRERVCQYV